MKNHGNQLRFTKVFDQVATQTDVFSDIAKPIINSVFNGFNGTIFAYGQTGSGKTYSITGSPNRYEDRGILPRSIEQIFEYIKTTSTQYSVYVSYLEIYNEIGYDLLNCKHQPCKLEELPRVALLEDANGEAHLRNLSILPVTSEREAMRLLFLGDTNRTIAETPMNEYSSRSHCIFTVHITVTSEKSEKIRRSKLHLVDLAGSERIHKSKISGVTLNEAKHINLSLHYLEQVIVALSQTRRSHIPFRNSIMTYILRDSLSGNSLTAMLATLAMTRKNVHETLTTCKFAQRVASICTEATINEEIDPQKEILFLRQEVDELRRQLIQLKGINANEKLSEKREENCRKIVKDYVAGSSELPTDLTTLEMRFCLKIMRDGIDRRKRNPPSRQTERSNSNLALKYNEIVAEKDEEIDTLRQLLSATSQFPTTNCPANDFPKNSPELPPYEQGLYHQFKMEKGQDIEQMRSVLNKKYEFVRNITATIQKCQDNITNIRKQLTSSNSPNVNEKLGSYLLSQQNIYRDCLSQLERLRNEIGFLKESLKQAENKLLYKFKQEKDFIAEKDTFTSNSSDYYSNSNSYFKGMEGSRKIPSSSQEFTDRIPELLSSTLSKSYLSYPVQNLDPNDIYLEQNLNNFYDLSKKSFADLYGADDKDINLVNHPHSDEVYAIPTREMNPQNTKQFLDQLLSDAPEDDCLENGIGDNRNLQEELPDSGNESTNLSLLRKDDDSPEFLNFMETVPLTGDLEVDEEIFNFYRMKFHKKS